MEVGVGRMGYGVAQPHRVAPRDHDALGPKRDTNARAHTHFRPAPAPVAPAGLDFANVIELEAPYTPPAGWAALGAYNRQAPAAPFLAPPRLPLCRGRGGIPSLHHHGIALSCTTNPAWAGQRLAAHSQ